MCNKLLDSVTVAEHQAELYCRHCHGRRYGPKGVGFGMGGGTLTMGTGGQFGNKTVEMTRCAVKSVQSKSKPVIMMRGGRPQRHMGGGMQPVMPNQAYLVNIFAAVDTNKSGRISAVELQAALGNGTWDLLFGSWDPETVKLMVAMFDRNFDYSIDFNEFTQLWQSLITWQASFYAYDQNRSGAISLRDLKFALLANGYTLSDQFCAYLMHKMDPAKRGLLLFEDYVHLCLVLHILTAAFRAKDVHQTGNVQFSYEEFLTMTVSPRV